MRYETDYSHQKWYSSYKGMKERCNKPNCKQYKNYGGRGIKICEEWETVEGFAKWVEKNPYFEGASIDRIDVNGDYEPSNCRWATPKIQANNRRNTLYIGCNGEVHTVSEWAEITGINPSTLRNRYKRGDRGLDLFRPSNKRSGRYHVKAKCNNAC